MDKQRKLIIAGNWKMNKTVPDAVELASQLQTDLGKVTELDVVVCPPFTALSEVSRVLRASTMRVGAQNMSEHPYGAFTGEIAAGMLKDLLVRYVILGHSERRQFQNETDALVNAKMKAALAAGLKPIVCVGETFSQREAGQTEQIVGDQLTGSLAGLDAEPMQESILAYEPVWAIGTGRTATPEQAQQVHAFIRGWLSRRFDDTTARRVRIQYGGSVKPGNARELMGQPDIDGALVGGASLDAHTFIEIVRNSL